jgi:serine protease AprX
LLRTSNSLSKTLFHKSNRLLAALLVIALSGLPALGGITFSAANGIVMTGADGIVMTGADGIVMTGADGVLTYGADGIVMTGADGIVMTGADNFYSPNSVRMVGADGIVMTGADGIVMTGADGIVMTGADGSSYRADSVTIRNANGIVMTGADGIVMTGADGVHQTGANGIVMTGADGIVMTGADGIVMTGADSIQGTGADGVVYSVAPNSVRFNGVTGIVMTGADGISVSGANGILMTGADGLVLAGDEATRTGLQSVDPELLARLNTLTDDSNVNAVLVYYHLPTAVDFADLQRLGVLGGTRYRALPFLTITATRRQLIALSNLPAIKSIYGTRTLDPTLEPEVRAVTGVSRTWNDRYLTTRNQGLPVSGHGVTVAVIDTGVDGTHGDLAGRVTQNVKLADTQSASVGFNYPINVENLSNTDQAYGHGTFVAGVIAGNGSQSGGRYSGVAPGARVVGLSAGDLSLTYVLEGFDYLLAHNSDLRVGVVNCSFSANTIFDSNDPVNVATRMLTEQGINVVFSAGNTGPGLHSLNPYAVAPWVVSVGATDTNGKLADFSSRGDFGSEMFHPTVVAPGVGVVSLRGSGIANVTGAEGVTVGEDTGRLSTTELPYYTTASGTSFSAPQVAGVIALMLEVNPALTPAQVKKVLQRTATPLPPYYSHEVGAGMLNAHAAVLQSAYPELTLGAWRGTLNWGQVSFANDPATSFSGTASPTGTVESTLTIPSDALVASVQLAWGPYWSLNDLGLSLSGPNSLPARNAVRIYRPSLTGNRQRIAINVPAAGAWRASVRSLGGGSSVLSQPFVGVLEVGKARYAPMDDLEGLSPALRNDIRQSIRSLAMWPIGRRFRPAMAVTRADLATALVLGARVPQYQAPQALYSDVTDATRIFVESAQASPTGALFGDVSRGGNFRPVNSASRLTAVVALVRVAGLSQEAEAKRNAPLAFIDVLTIPAELRGYVNVALARGLISPESSFRPQNSFTRGELAHALTVVQNLAVSQ